MNSSVVVWPDRPTVESALRRWADEVARGRPELRRVGYFGSYARGDWGVGSDLDVVLVVAGADLPFARRPAAWDLTRLPVPADALVYTEEEWRRLEPASRFARVLTREVVWVWPKETPAITTDLAARRAAYVQQLDEALSRVVETLSRIAGVRRVSVFGSYARGRRDLFTDLDLFVVWETERPSLDRLRFLYSVLDVAVDLDIVCYTLGELEARRDGPFVRQLAREEVVLYERQSG